ncbi:hypothetical protein [Pseudoclavibacter sp. 13-3]|uniref:hypothetical protein n=1 Tax=Pseudoclavibacter sp. 13-3 TaxID=2901228 RepID=UPI001E2970A3|nr:hypothetical protein [Pseudoclavibacter sp. 13-3]MCD7101732.1 hypothetical protein [Pseudoclavibacter sp. 13-3]
MADGIKATVEGMVKRVFKRGSVVEIQRESRDGRQKWLDYVTIWDLFGMQAGDQVRVSGELTSSLRYYNGRAQVQTSLNNLTGQEKIGHVELGGDSTEYPGEHDLATASAGSGSAWGE